MPVARTNAFAWTMTSLRDAANVATATPTHGNRRALTTFATVARFHVCTAAMPACAAAFVASDQLRP